MLRALLAAVFSLVVACAHAQGALQTSGALLIVPGTGEVVRANDEARVTFNVEEQDKDKAAAASRVNLKMKQGVELVKSLDKQATLKTRGYYTYPVYAEEPVRNPTNKIRPVVGWRVGQYLDIKTTSLDSLPRTVATLQKTLALNGIQFGLSAVTAKLLDAERIDATYKNLNERIAMIARAMGRNLADASLESVDFEASGAYAQPEMVMSKGARAFSAMAEAPPVEEPSFEAGETTLSMRVVAKVRFK
jgi:predicted secreted protein